MNERPVPDEHAHMHNGQLGTGVSTNALNSCKTQRGLHGNAWLPCSPLWVLQLFCHPKYSILYGALILFTVGSGQE